MIRIVVAGAAGRMGKAILCLAHQDPAFKIVGGLEHEDCPLMGEDVGDLIGCDALGAKLVSRPDVLLKEADVLIDFTQAAAVPETLKAVLKTGVRYVVGTTGIKKDVLKLLQAASKKVAIVQSPNMSIGVNVLFGLTELAGKFLDQAYDIEISEIHHRGKKDAPSGTALKLLEILSVARQINSEKDARYGRKGDIGARTREEIGVMALRGGDVVGEHTVYFLGSGERIELTHRATSRDAFALGALKAAKFVAGKKSGFFDMRQVLGLT
ncbi:MAG: 4-hydroxy-tetrahydrodipicolinate reductase [Candidatus Omnitrophica bacterium]|nr:4-hydroxy-tetrahydrodipicolinate reductase [Candidatus Omnitrophota bacterium]MDD5671786.1 4-hydroxy-tetrahydrodipicolinate reductase [Candidatus Omnitrophota bacterium]